MNTNESFTWEQAKEIADLAVFQYSEERLKDVEIFVLQGAWQGLKYKEMALISNYGEDYLRGDVGAKLWKKLSSALGQKVKKSNFKNCLQMAESGLLFVNPVVNDGVLERRTTNYSLLSFSHSLDIPEGPVPLGSLLYIERKGVESICYDAIIKPGCLIRIKAPRLMGKTSLLQRILERGGSVNYNHVHLNLNTGLEKEILKDLDKFLRWLCAMVGRQLNLENLLKDYWDTEILGSNVNCTIYFEEYILPAIDRPLVLQLDDVDAIFPYTDTVEDFLGMLRSWHEKGKISQRWKQLRLVIAHSTECYVPLDLNQSPFNAGIHIELPEFDLHQVLLLADMHGLNWQAPEAELLIDMIGGHPHLVRLALYELYCGNLTLEQLLEKASTESWIYSAHLRRHLEAIKHNRELAMALQKVVSASAPVELDSVQTYKLHSMGLVRHYNNLVVPRCRLYREYFQRILSA